jgi:benzodiazapine receptor
VKLSEVQLSSVKMKRNDWIGLGIALLIPQVAGGLGAIATASSIPTWYQTIKKPSWNPPSWIFGPVWTTLYLLMGIASWLIWRQGRERKVRQTAAAEAPAGIPLALPEDPQERGALGLYGAQLFLNSLWSIIFFGMKSIGGGLAEIVLLWGLIAATVARFFRLRPTAGWLMVPYLAWATFASVLNATVWRLNR